MSRSHHQIRTFQCQARLYKCVIVPLCLFGVQINLSSLLLTLPFPPLLPFDHRRSPSSNPPLPSPPKTRKKAPLIIGGLLVYVFTTFAVHEYVTLSRPGPVIAQDTDTSARFDETASTFDVDVSFAETSSGIKTWRSKLVPKAHGHVLEMSVGTGRNSAYYDMSKCTSLTFVDQSAPMMRIAREKFYALHPTYRAANFYTQSAQSPLPSGIITTSGPEDGFYDTIVQTMGLCSTPEPVALLAHLGTLAKPDTGRILLLEHGRSHYEWVNWVLDRAAGAHAVRHGCWWNRDIGRIVADSGMVVERVQRRHLGTTWWLELKPRKSDDAMAAAEQKGKE